MISPNHISSLLLTLPPPCLADISFGIQHSAFFIAKTSNYGTVSQAIGRKNFTWQSCIFFPFYLQIGLLSYRILLKTDRMRPPVPISWVVLTIPPVPYLQRHTGKILRWEVKKKFHGDITRVTNFSTLNSWVITTQYTSSTI